MTVINRSDRFELMEGDVFTPHKLNGGAKTLVESGDRNWYSAEHRSRHPGRHVEDDVVFRASQAVAISGGSGKVFRAVVVNGPLEGHTVSVHTNHVWPFCPYLRASSGEASAEAQRQAEVVRVAAGGGSSARSAPVPPAGAVLREGAAVPYDSGGAKRTTTVSVNGELLDCAKRFGLNVSEILEARLAELVRARLRDQWLEQNREALAAYNARVESVGVFGDDGRVF